MFSECYDYTFSSYTYTRIMQNKYKKFTSPMNAQIVLRKSKISVIECISRLVMKHTCYDQSLFVERYVKFSFQISITWEILKDVIPECFYLDYRIFIRYMNKMCLWVNELNLPNYHGVLHVTDYMRCLLKICVYFWDPSQTHKTVS